MVSRMAVMKVLKKVALMEHLSAGLLADDSAAQSAVLSAGLLAVLKAE